MICWYFDSADLRIWGDASGLYSTIDAKEWSECPYLGMRSPFPRSHPSRGAWIENEALLKEVKAVIDNPDATAKDVAQMLKRMTDFEYEYATPDPDLDPDPDPDTPGTDDPSKPGTGDTDTDKPGNKPGDGAEDSGKTNDKPKPPLSATGANVTAISVAVMALASAATVLLTIKRRRG